MGTFSTYMCWVRNLKFRREISLTITGFSKPFKYLAWACSAKLVRVKQVRFLIN